MRIFKKFYYNFKRSSKWFIRMWGNYDWDYNYLIEMMVDKMKDMRNQFDNVDVKYVDLRHQPKSFTDDNGETVDNLTGLDKAIELGERILTHDYIEYTPDIDEWHKTHDIFEDNIPDDIKKKFNKIHEKAEKMENNDRKKFFNTIRDEHIKWWS